MISENYVDRRAVLGRTPWNFDADDDMVCVGELSPTLKVYIDNSPTAIIHTMVYVTEKVTKGRPRIVVELCLEVKRSLFGMLTYSVAMVSVDDRYKGFNLASKLYAFLLKKYPQWILMSGTSQSFGGRHVWNVLCRQRGISVYAVDPKCPDEFFKCEYNKEGDLECLVDVYEPGSPYYLYATSTK